MAEFGVQATTLADPQHAGANGVAPVKEGLPTGSSKQDLINAGGDIAAAFKAMFKTDPKKEENAVVQRYTTEQAAINKAHAAGFFTSGEAAARSQALVSEYAQTPHYEAIGRAAAVMKGYSELGQINKNVDSDEDIRKARVLAAQSAGFPIPQGSAPEFVDSQIKAHMASVRLRQETADLHAKQQEERANGTYNAGIADAESKKQSWNLVNQIAAVNLESFGVLGKSLVDGVRKDPTTFQTASDTFTKHYAGIEAQMQAAAQMNPELAAPFRSIFKGMHDTYMKMFDPKANLDELNREIDTLKNKQKLVLVSDPSMAKIIAASETLGNNAQVALGSSAYVTDTIAKLFSTNPDSKEFVPTIVGDKATEKHVFANLTSSIQKLNSGVYKDEDKAKGEISNTIRNTLKQVGRTVGTDISSKHLEEAAKFFSSPEFGKFASENKLSGQELTAAQHALGTTYEAAVFRGVEVQMKNAFDKAGKSVAHAYSMNPTPSRGNSLQVTTPASKELTMDNLTLSFNGSGIEYKMKQFPTDPTQARIALDILSDLNGSQNALNQTLRMDSHLQGHTNYAKTFEERKHMYAPTMFSRYKDLQIGDVKEGMRYKGGDAKSPNAWEAVK